MWPTTRPHSGPAEDSPRSRRTRPRATPIVKFDSAASSMHAGVFTAWSEAERLDYVACIAVALLRCRQSMILATSIGGKAVTVGAFVYGLVFTDGPSQLGGDVWQTLEACEKDRAEYDERAGRNRDGPAGRKRSLTRRAPHSPHILSRPHCPAGRRRYDRIAAVVRSSQFNRHPGTAASSSPRTSTRTCSAASTLTLWDPRGAAVDGASGNHPAAPAGIAGTGEVSNE